VSGRRIGAAILVTPLLLFSKGRKHYMTITFDDGKNAVGAVEFKLHKGNYRPILRSVETVAGVKMQYDQEGIKDKEQQPAESKAAGEKMEDEGEESQTAAEVGDKAETSHSTQSLSSDEVSDVPVYTTTTLKTYHREGCPYLPYGAKSVPLREAKKDKTPCQVCKPVQ
jgi:hypothetical protein